MLASPAELPPQQKVKQLDFSNPPNLSFENKRQFADFSNLKTRCRRASGGACLERRSGWSGFGTRTFLRQVTADIVRLPVPQDEQARANTERTQRLFDWATWILGDLGLTKAVAQVTSVAELRGITLNVAGAEISLAIRNRSLDDCYRAIRERVAAGGKGCVMTEILMMTVVLGTVTLALAIDVVTVVAWTRRRWR